MATKLYGQYVFESDTAAEHLAAKAYLESLTLPQSMTLSSDDVAKTVTLKQLQTAEWTIPSG